MPIDYEKIPDGMFLPAFLIRDIRKASVLPRHKRKAGGPDIVLRSPLGITEVIPRKLLVSNFRYLNGKRIHLGAWKNNKATLVILAGSPNARYYALKIPKGREVRTENKLIKDQEVYIVCGDNDGIDRNQVYLVTPKLFNKMFKMEGSLSNLKSNNVKIKARVKSRQDNSKPENVVANTNRQDIPKVKNVDTLNNVSKVENTEVIIKYTPVGKIVQMGKTVGFELVDNMNNGYIVDIPHMVELVHKGQVNNVAIRRTATGMHLYGVGIRLSDLPEVNN